MLNGNGPKLTREIEDILQSSRPEHSRSVMQRLLGIGALMDQEEGDRFVDANPCLLKLSHIAAKHYETYILEAEDEEAKKILDLSNGTDFCFTSFANLFGKQAYDRVSDIFHHVDFASCQRFVMVGCGALPVTVFQVYEHTEVPHIIGLDCRPEAIETFEQTVKKFDLDRIEPVQRSGQEFDFAGADVVYIANLVSPKKEVLERIAETAADNVQIVMRDPYSIGRLWTERGIDKLDRDFEILAYGKPGPAYFSRDVFVNRKH